MGIAQYITHPHLETVRLTRHRMATSIADTSVATLASGLSPVLVLGLSTLMVTFSAVLTSLVLPRLPVNALRSLDQELQTTKEILGRDMFDGMLVSSHFVLTSQLSLAK